MCSNFITHVRICVMGTMPVILTGFYRSCEMGKQILPSTELICLCNHLRKTTCFSNKSMPFSQYNIPAKIIIYILIISVNIVHVPPVLDIVTIYFLNPHYMYKW